MADNKVRVGFVGVGRMGQCAHLRNYAAMDECEVVALAELREKTAERVAERYNIPNVYSDAVQMLEKEDLDCLVCSQPFNRHGILLPELLRANKPIFIEKPLSSTPESGKAILEELEKSDTFIMVGYHKRSDPACMWALEKIRQLRESGELGRMKYMRIEMPMGDWIAHGFDVLINEGDAAPNLECEPKSIDMDDQTFDEYQAFVNFYIHQVNLMRYFLGEDYHVSYADPKGILLVAHSDSGIPCTIEMDAFATTVEWQEHVMIGFEKGWMQLDLPAPLAYNRCGRVRMYKNPEHGTTPMHIEPTMPYVHAMRRQAENFIAAVNGERAPMCDAATALKDMEVATEYIRMLKGQSAACC